MGEGFTGGEKKPRGRGETRAEEKAWQRDDAGRGDLLVRQIRGSQAVAYRIPSLPLPVPRGGEGCHGAADVRVRKGRPPLPKSKKSLHSKSGAQK